MTEEDMEVTIVIEEYYEEIQTYPRPAKHYNYVD